MKILKIILIPFFIMTSLLPTNAFADIDFDIIKVSNYECKGNCGMRTAKVTVKNIRQLSSVISLEDFVGITADGKRIRAKAGSANRINGYKTYTLMLHFGNQKYPIEEIDFYWK